MTGKDVVRNILRDVRVEVSQEFDRNFERQGFFSQAWKRRTSPVRGNGPVLIASGALRRSVKSKIDKDSITFYSSLPYAEIHNEGGAIKVTRKMKRFFWAKYYEATGGFRRRKDGSLSRSRKQVHLGTVAEFWKALALKKVGSTVTIPQRKFLGTSAELEAGVRKVIEDNIETYLNTVKDMIK